MLMLTVKMKICATLAVIGALAVTGAKAGFVEDFDSYANGSQMHGQGGWKGWDNNPADGALVSSAQSSSAPHSVDINGGSDLVHEFDGLTSGSHVLTAQQYIPTASDSGTTYYILLNQYNDGTPYNWSVQMAFNLSAGTVVEDLLGGALTPQTIVRDQWVELKVEVDLDANTVTAYYNGLQLRSGAWYGAQKEIDAIDLYAGGADSVYYDDIVIPEPATMGLLVLGGLALIRRRR